MDSLPSELKQKICSFLSPKELKPLRLASKSLADAASPCLIPRLFLFNHPDSCTQVQTIAEHPIFSKHITTLVFDPSRVREYDSRSEWYWDQDNGWLSSDDSEEEDNELIRNQYAASLNAIQLQTQPDLHDNVLRSVATAFSNCPNLKNLIMTTEHSKATKNRQEHIFQGMLLVPRTRFIPGKQQEYEFSLSEILSAYSSRRNLHSLSIIANPLRSYEVPGSGVFSGLRHLRIAFGYQPYGGDNDMTFSMDEALRSAHLLETVWLDLCGVCFDNSLYDRILRAVDSKNLRDCMLSGFLTSEDELVDFLLRHADSLRQLEISDMVLVKGSWSSCIQRVSCQLSCLEHMKLFSICLGDTETWWFRELTTRFADQAAKFIKDGGKLPEERFAIEFQDENDQNLRREKRPEQSIENGLWPDYDSIVNGFFVDKGQMSYRLS